MSPPRTSLLLPSAPSELERRLQRCFQAKGGSYGAGGYAEWGGGWDRDRVGVLLSCGTTERAWDQTPGCGERFQPATLLFSFQGAAQVFWFNHNLSQDQVSVTGIGDLCGMSHLTAFPSSPSQPSHPAAPPPSSHSPSPCQLGPFSLLYLVFRVMKADAPSCPPQPAKQETGCHLRTCFALGAAV